MDLTQRSSLDSELCGSKALIFNFEKNLNEITLEQCKINYKKLSYLCHHYDPYDQSDIENTEVKNILNSTGLSEYIANPFEYTNLLLQMMDKSETKIKSLEH